MAPKRGAEDEPSGSDKRPRTSGGGSGSGGAASGAPSQSAIAAQMAAARAQVEARLAAMKAGNGRAAPAATPAGLPARPAAPAAGPAAASAPMGIDQSAIARQLAAAKAKIAAQMAQSSSSAPAARPPAPTSAPPERNDQRSGTGIHPLLMGRDPKPSLGSVPRTSKSSKGNKGVKAPKFSVLSSVNAKLEAPRANPYLAESSAAAASSSGKGGNAKAPAIASGTSNAAIVPKERSMHKGLQFARPGKHIRAAEELRREQQMEALRLRMEEKARLAALAQGVGEEEQVLKREMPPDVEWWDEQFLPEGTYDGVGDEATTIKIESDAASADKPAAPLIEGDGTPIDAYVQHPIPIPAPTDKIKVEPRGVMLTKKEMKKMRRQRRAAELQDKRDRIKMGLLPPDPPKVKLSNLMRVLTSEAVADPTKVEAKVRREVAARKEQHERTNLERKLTPEQVKAKEEARKQKDEQKGIFSCVFRIKHLASPSHKFKVVRNAYQYGLTGLVIFHPDFAMVVVEGPAKAIKDYKRLMTIRINWQDPGRPRDATPEDVPEEGDADAEAAAAAAKAAKAEEELGKPGHRTQAELEAIDWSTNSCDLIFEGPLRERRIRRGLITRNVETDKEARSVLGLHMEGYWALAKKIDAASADD